MLHVVRTLPEFNLVRLLRRRGIDTTPLLQWGVIIAVLLASVLIGLRPSILLLALPVGAAGALLFLRQPTLSCCSFYRRVWLSPFMGRAG